MQLDANATPGIRTRGGGLLSGRHAGVRTFPLATRLPEHAHGCASRPFVAPTKAARNHMLPRRAVGDEPNRVSQTPAGPQQRLLGVDYGTATTGLALGRGGVSSALQAIPSPRTSKLSDVARQVLALALQHGVEGIVVGIPVQSGGSLIKPDTDSPVGGRCRNFAHTLALVCKEHGLSVYLYSEKSTTRAAMKTMGYNWQDRMSRKEKEARHLDAESAAMLLRLYYGNPRQAVRINPRVVINTEAEELSTD